MLVYPPKVVARRPSCKEDNLNTTPIQAGGQSFRAAPGAMGLNSSVQCTEGLKMFVSRGTGEPMGLGASEAPVEIIAEQISGSNIEAIKFPATMEDPLYFTSVANSTIFVKLAITNHAMACPGSKMAVFGCSQVRAHEDHSMSKKS